MRAKQTTTSTTHCYRLLSMCLRSSNVQQSAPTIQTRNLISYLASSGSFLWLHSSQFQHNVQSSSVHSTSPPFFGTHSLTPIGDLSLALHVTSSDLLLFITIPLPSTPIYHHLLIIANHTTVLYLNVTHVLCLITRCIILSVHSKS